MSSRVAAGFSVLFLLTPGFAEGQSLPKRIAYDLQAQASFPLGVAQRQPSTFFLGSLGIVALIASDPVTYNAFASPSMKADARVTGPAGTLSKMGDGTTAIPIVLGLGAIGFIAGSDHEKQTSAMLLEAVATSAVWTGAIKFLAGRERPRDVHEFGSDWTGPNHVFDDDGTQRTNVSFPSGHATGAWAAATILAHQYPRAHIVPMVAYGTATAISYSRMLVGAHWLSDVVVGGVIGYGCARQVISAREPNTRAETSRVHFTINPIGVERSLGVTVDF